MSWDCYIDGVGYALAKDSQGRLVSSAYREQRSDPFMHYVSQADRWKRQTFKFEGGAGATLVDGTGRYRRGRCDTRGGNALLPPLLTMCQTSNVGNNGPTHLPVPTDDITDEALVNAGGAINAFAVRITMPISASVRSVSVLLKRAKGTSTDANGPVVEIWTNSGANKPLACIANATGTRLLKNPPGSYWEFDHDPWISGEYFWMTVNFPPAGALIPVAGGIYWLVVKNSTTKTIYWGRKTGDTSVRTCHSHTYGLTWPDDGVADNSARPYYRCRYHGEIDSETVKFCEFRSTDGVKRLYAGVGPKVMVLNDATMTWSNSLSGIVGDVTDLIVFNEMLFAAQGEGQPIYWMENGINWTQLTNDEPRWGQTLCLHDRYLWKANGADVWASLSGLDADWSSWNHLVTVGDHGTPITAMISHGGKLYAFKEEGVFEIWYNETWPDGAGPPDPEAYSNLVLDFKTDPASRPWALDWHSALYFPGSAGVMEWKSGVLRDLFSELDEGDDGIRARPLDCTIQTELGNFLAACGTTRGLYLAMMSGHLHQTTIWYYRNQTWHPIYEDEAADAEYCRAIYYQPLGAGQGRLWIARGANIGYFYLPVWTDDCTLDDRSRYEGSGWVELPEFDDGKPWETKDWYSLSITAENLGDGASVIMAYYMMEGPRVSQSWLGPIYFFPGDSMTKFFPANTASGRIRIKLVISGNLATDSVEIKDVTLKFHPMPDTVVMHQVIVKAATQQVTHSGGTDWRTVREIWNDLSDLTEKDEAIKFIDPLGREHTVKCVGVTPVAVRQIDGTGPEKTAAGQMPTAPVTFLTPANIEAQIMVSLIEV